MTRSPLIRRYVVAMAFATQFSAGGAEITLDGHKFTMVDGFVIERVAGPPLIERPIVADFDESGRLYVADSSGSNDKVEKQLAEKPHRIVRLEDTNSDGRFDRRTVFADKMMFPEGTMWYDGSLYVAAPPSIWKLTDTDGDGVADQRIEWFQGKTLTGCANDLHGPYLGPDGWIYWCKGAFAEQRYERPGRKPFVTKAAHIFRCRPDGSEIEPVMTGGMDNPVDVVFTPGGERIFTTTFLQHPGGGLRDGLIHAVYGGVYGKVHHVIEGHKRTGEIMPVLAHLGPAVPAGLVAYESTVFGDAYRHNLFAALFNLHKVTRHVLTPTGATFTSRDEDFLVSDNLDFHPTDVIEDADGSLLVVDTGGWYKLCCPTSQLPKPDVLGAIYRVRRHDARPSDDPRGLRLGWDRLSVHELAQLLGDPRPTVRRRAVHCIGRKGATAVATLTGRLESGSTQARRNAVWALTRITGVEARAGVRKALADSDDSVRQAAVHSISVHRDRDAVPMLVRLLSDPSLPVRRATAEALGRIGDPQAVGALLEAAGGRTDRVLEHSIIYALIEIADPRATAAGLTSSRSPMRRAALIALDQMDGGNVDGSLVTGLLDSSDAVLRETALWIAGRHPEWGVLLTRFLRDQLRAGESPAGSAKLRELLTRFARDPVVQKLLAETVVDSRLPKRSRQAALDAMAGAGAKEVPAVWLPAVEQVMAGADTDLALAAIAVMRTVPPGKDQVQRVADGLKKLGLNPGVLAQVRLEALAAMPVGLSNAEPDLLNFLCAHLDPNRPVRERSAAAEALSKARLTSDQLATLTELFQIAGPLEADRLLAAFEQSTEEAVGLKLVAALKTAPALTSLRPDALRNRLSKYGEKVTREAQALYAKLSVDVVQQQSRLEQILASLQGGDVRRGQAVFHSPKATCNACHAIGYLGGTIGPDLTRIGQTRSPRDLVESIVFPSASFVRNYEPVVVATKDGRLFNGLVRQNGPDAIVLATGTREEARIAHADVEEIRPSTVSLMPSGLDQQLTLQELADLVEFLKAAK